MTERRRLPNRHPCITLPVRCNGLCYSATASFFSNGDLAEIFLGNAKAGSHSDAAAKDAAVLCSIALQYGAPADVLRRALLRDSRGAPSSPLGAALDAIADTHAHKG